MPAPRRTERLSLAGRLTVLGLLAALLWGLTTLTLRATRLATASAEKTLLWQLGVSGVALTAAGLLRGEVWPAVVGALPWAALAFQTVIVSFASYLVWFWLLRHYPASRLGVFSFMTPLFGVLFGVWLLGERLEPPFVAGSALVLAGIALVSAHQAVARAVGPWRRRVFSPGRR